MARTEDQVRDQAKKILGFDDDEKYVQQGTGQITTFNQLGFTDVKRKSKKPDGWYLPQNKTLPCIIYESKSEDEDVFQPKWEQEIRDNMAIAATKYRHILGILDNGLETRIFKDGVELTGVAKTLQHKSYYLNLYKKPVDKQTLYSLTKKINDCLHTEFGITNLYHRMIFTACALVAERYDANLSAVKGMDYTTFHTRIHTVLAKSLEKAKKQNEKLDILLEVFSSIKMNSTENQKAIDNFIDWVCQIYETVNNSDWNGEDIMAIFFNEFNRYKKKSQSGQVFTPDHITSLMYRIIHVDQDDKVLDAACGSGAFLVKAMCNMMNEAGGQETNKAKEIKAHQLYGIEFDREIFALACANMLIHQDGKTNLTQMDTRTEEAGLWIKSKEVSKVLMNPPFERKYGCLKIVKNVLDNVPKHTDCAIILPDKKLEKDMKDKRFGNALLKNHTLKKIIKLPENLFFGQGVTTSIFVFEAGVPQDDKNIFACYIDDDGLETVKNQGRHDVRNKWPALEDKWTDIIERMSGDPSVQWIDPSEHLSYQKPEKPFEVYEEDFLKTMMDYVMFEKGVDASSMQNQLIQKILYSSSVRAENGNISIVFNKGDGPDED